MANHPRRSRGSRGYVPGPEEIELARTARRLTQAAAAALLYKGVRTWQQWEAGDRKMDPALWELFIAKCGPAAGQDSDPPDATSPPSPPDPPDPPALADRSRAQENV